MFRSLKPIVYAGTTVAVLFASAAAAHERNREGEPQPGMMKGGGNMPMMGMMNEMSDMMDACNKMMQAHSDRQERGAPPAEPQHN